MSFLKHIILTTCKNSINLMPEPKGFTVFSNILSILKSFHWNTRTWPKTFMLTIIMYQENSMPSLCQAFKSCPSEFWWKCSLGFLKNAISTESFSVASDVVPVHLSKGDFQIWSTWTSLIGLQYKAHKNCMKWMKTCKLKKRK